MICTAEGCIWFFNDTTTVPRMVGSLKGMKAAGVATSQEHTVICTTEGCVWTLDIWGLNTCGIQPQMVEGLQNVKVVQVAAGAMHTVIRSDEGHVWTFGNGGCGQLGHGADGNEKVPRMVEGLKNVKVVQVATGPKHTVILSDNRSVWTFGGYDKGKLGHRECASEIPRMVEGLEGVKVTQVAASTDYTVVYTAQESVIICGRACDRRRLPFDVDIRINATWMQVQVPHPHPHPLPLPCSSPSTL